MIVGCYTLELYCDAPDCPWRPHQFTGRTEAECIRAAKSVGWRLDKKKGIAKCKAHRHLRITVPK